MYYHNPDTELPKISSSVKVHNWSGQRPWVTEHLGNGGLGSRSLSAAHIQSSSMVSHLL